MRELSPYAKRACDNLRKLINKSGMTAYQVSKESGVGKATISQYLAGSREPRIEILERLAKVLKVNFVDFFKA